MRWIRLYTVLLIALVSGCEKLPTLDWVNPLDLEVAAEDSVDTPALVFFPDSVAVETGSSVQLQVFAMKVDSLSGAHIQISYEQEKMSLLSATVGDFFQAANTPMFFFNDDTTYGILDIYTISVGTDTLREVSGTGNLAYLEFQTLASGKLILEYTDESELVDADDNQIEIQTFSKGIINAE